MRVEIHHIWDATSYIVKDESDCKGDTDLSVYREVIKLNSMITMGQVIGVPIKNVNQRPEKMRDYPEN